MDINAKNDDSNHDVKSRILTASEELFSENGFTKTSVRDITKKAGCNVASVNYYFGNKDHLYLEVCRRNLITLRDIRVNAIDRLIEEKKDAAKMADLVRVFVVAFLEPFSEDANGYKRLMLLWREMIDPHLPKQAVFEEVIKPVSAAFLKAFETICPGVEQHRVYLCMQSIVGQLAHITMALQIYPGRNGVFYNTLDMDKYIDHVVEFSTAGIFKIAGKGQSNEN